MDKRPLIPLEDLLAFLPDHVYWLDKNGIYQGCNDSQAKMMGLASRDEIIGMRNKDLPCFKNHPELAEILDENNSDIMKSGQPKRLEEVAYDANGILSAYLSHKVPLKDLNNNVIGLLGSSYKIDDIKAKEDRLLAEKENAEFTLKGIIAHLPGHVYWKDKEGYYLGCNDKQARSLGFESETELIGKSDFELPWPAGSALEFRENDLEVMTTGKTKTAEENSTIDGREAIVLSQKVPLKNKAGQIRGIIGISVDITELKKAQEQEKKALEEVAYAKTKAAAEEATKRAILIFSGMQSHDLRTPLATINGTAKMLGDDISNLISAYKMATQAGLDVPNISENKLNYFERIPKTILRCVESANKYIDDSLKSIKGASLGESMINKGELVHCNASLLLQRIETNYPYTEKNIRNLIHINTSQFFHFMGNEIFFNRLLENLIKNAFEQIELKNHGEIFIECHKGDVFNTITIKDTAGGVTQDRINNLFNGIQSAKDGGTGIGLSSAKHIMNAMGGDISCHLVNQDCIEFILSFPKINKNDS